jgi:hypothetical protein
LPFLDFKVDAGENGSKDNRYEMETGMPSYSPVFSPAASLEVGDALGGSCHVAFPVAFKDQVELENIILSEVSLAQKTKNRMFSLICGH